MKNIIFVICLLLIFLSCKKHSYKYRYVCTYEVYQKGYKIDRIDIKLYNYDSCKSFYNENGNLYYKFIKKVKIEK